MIVPTLGVRIATGPLVNAPTKDGPRSLLALAVAAESAGADSFVLDDTRPPGSANDPFVLLGAVSGATSRISLGCVANPLGARQPSVIAKSVASLDVVSGGRALACLSMRRGPANEDPLGELTEALAVVRLMLDVDGASFEGEHYSISRAYNEPRTKRATPIPLGILLSESTTDATGPSAAAELLAAVTSDANFVVTDATHASAPIDSGVRLLRLIATDESDEPGSVAGRVAQAIDAGGAGAILDWQTPPSPEHLAEVVRTVAAGFGGREVGGRSD